MVREVRNSVGGEAASNKRKRAPDKTTSCTRSFPVFCNTSLLIGPFRNKQTTVRLSAQPFRKNIHATRFIGRFPSAAAPRPRTKHQTPLPFPCAKLGSRLLPTWHCPFHRGDWLFPQNYCEIYRLGNVLHQSIVRNFIENKLIQVGLGNQF